MEFTMTDEASAADPGGPSDARRDGDTFDLLIDGALRAGFERDGHAAPPKPGGNTVLAKLSRAGRTIAGINLTREASGARMAHSQADAPPDIPRRIGRYDITREISRGGVGAVLLGRDADLGREIAIKLLLEQHATSDEMVRRLVEEAQIGGQLEHPGIVPVHELGLVAGELPYLTMKLVKGRTLAELLDEREDPRQDRQHYLGILQQVCQAIAYAHSRRVIHRDLKPLNMMVGEFGEVQVMDWGLAKVLSRRDAAQKVPDGRDSIHTVRTEDATASTVGAVMGTPAYMAPEQARGETGTIDERADVFGLGAILCEILTGRPPYGDGSLEELLRRARDGQVDEARERLSSCGADRDAIDLALACLEPDRSKRLRDAREVARRMSAYLGSLEERAQLASLEATEARVRAEGERKARIRTLAGGVVSLVLLAGLLAALGFQQFAREEQELVERSRSDLESRVSRIVENLQRRARPTLETLLRTTGADEIAEFESRAGVTGRAFLLSGDKIVWPSDGNGDAPDSAIPWRDSAADPVDRRLLDDAYVYLAAGLRSEARFALETLIATNPGFNVRAEATMQLARIIDGNTDGGEAQARLAELLESLIASAKEGESRDPSAVSWVLAALEVRAKLHSQADEAAASAARLLELLERLVDEEARVSGGVRDSYRPLLDERAAQSRAALAEDLRERWGIAAATLRRFDDEAIFRLEIDEIWRPTLRARPASNRVEHTVRWNDGQRRIVASLRSEDGQTIAGMIRLEDAVLGVLQEHLGDSDSPVGVREVDGGVVFGEPSPNSRVIVVASFDGEFEWAAWMDLRPARERLRRQVSVRYGSMVAVVFLLLAVLVLTSWRGLARRPGDSTRSIG